MRFMTLGVTEAAPQAVALALAIGLALGGFGYWRWSLKPSPWRRWR